MADAHIAHKILFLDVYVRVFPEEITFESIDSMKKTIPHQCEGATCMQTVEGLKATKRWMEGEFSP